MMIGKATHINTGLVLKAFEKEGIDFSQDLKGIYNQIEIPLNFSQFEARVQKMLEEGYLEYKDGVLTVRDSTKPMKIEPKKEPKPKKPPVPKKAE